MGDARMPFLMSPAPCSGLVANAGSSATVAVLPSPQMPRPAHRAAPAAALFAGFLTYLALRARRRVLRGARVLAGENEKAATTGVEASASVPTSGLAVVVLAAAVYTSNIGA